MSANKLPELTPAQKRLVRQFKETYKNYGHVRVIRKGQKTGHVLIIARHKGVDHYHWYDGAGHPVDHADQLPLIAPDENGNNKRTSAINQDTGE